MSFTDDQPAGLLTIDVELVVAHPDGDGFDPALMTRLARHVLDEEGTEGAWSVAVALVDDEALRLLHERFMGIPTVTDVMTFPRQSGPSEPLGPGGDIVISLDRAWAQGLEHGMAGKRETLFLFIHGLLHLQGWDDGTPDKRRAMLARQETLLRLFDSGALKND